MTSKSTLPISGSEPTFHEKPWGTKKGIKNSNCYSYSMDNYSNRRPVKAVPGDRAGMGDLQEPLSCPDLSRRVLADNPKTVYREVPEKSCKKGYYKVMMFVDSSDVLMGDFHFYRQHKDVDYTVHDDDTLESIARMFRVSTAFIRKHNQGASEIREGVVLHLPNVNVWSHKLGHATGALLKDSCGKAIKDPRKACRSYSHTYKDFCGSFCAKRGSVRTSIVKGHSPKRSET